MLPSERDSSMRNAALFVFLILAATVAPAQVTIGSLPGNALFNLGVSTQNAVTYIDVGHPAIADTSLTSVTVYGMFRTCGNTFKLKFIRPTQGSANYTTVAERGPYSINASGSDSVFVSAVFSPPIAVRAGDYLALTMFQGCGTVNVGIASSPSLMEFEFDLPVNGSLTGNLLPLAPAMRASSDINVLEGVIAAAGSVPGANGSNFRTSLQLSNPFPTTIQGKLVFHPAGTTASGSDPSLPYTLAPHATVSYPDVIAALNGAGLGSLDIVTNASGSPVATTRIFNDLGTAGTSGFTEPAIRPSAALGSADYGSFTEPADLTNYRMSVGIRTLGDGAQLLVSQYDQTGNKIGSTITKNYSPSFFEQVPLATFLGATPVASGQVRFLLNSGAIIVYASTTDNRTNDSSAFFASRP